MKKIYAIYLIYSLIFMASVLSFWRGFDQDAFGYRILIFLVLNPISISISGISIGKQRVFKFFKIPISFLFWHMIYDAQLLYIFIS